MNYLEHEKTVKYVDGLLAHSQDWQWMIDEIEGCFEIKEVHSWKQYLGEYGPMRTVFEYFVKILQVCDKNWIFSKKEFEEIWEIAKFYIGSISANECKDKVSKIQCKLFFFCVWITKLENADNTMASNEKKYLYDIRLITQKNFFELIKCDSLLEFEYELLNYAKTIPISDIDIPVKNLQDNLEQVEYPCDSKFLDQYRKEILNYNSFSFQSLNDKLCQTWQELYLLDMLRTSFRKRKIQPIYESGNESVPDISMWSEEILDAIKRYFNHIVADFVIESISYIKFKVEPSKEVKMLHCGLLLKAIESGEEMYKIFTSSSYCILSYLFQDKLMKEYNKEDNYIRLLKKIQEWKEPTWIIKMKDDGYPISKEQKRIIANFYEDKYKQIDNVLAIHELLNYLKDKVATRTITTEYLKKVHEKFKKYTEENSVDVAAVYYQYMLFLIDINQSNPNIDKRVVQKEMLYIQREWQEKTYGRLCENMQKISYEQNFESEQLEKYSEMALTNPIFFAQNCTPTSEKALLQIMQDTSENVLIHLCRGMILSPIYPVERDKVVYERHEIDGRLLEYIKNLKHKKGYTLLNQLDDEVLVGSIHNRYKTKTLSSVSLFVKEEKLYNIVKTETQMELLPYSDKLTLAILTQLFPVLEIKIRELVTLFGIFPFKKNMEQFMQYNDPSSLLRELLEMIWGEQQSFENVPDLIYVYNIMYNSNSCNVRNECIHGRAYLSRGDLKFAFVATLFAIHMVAFRIKTIKDNVSDIIVLDED